METAIGWIVIFGVGYIVFRAFRKWRREYKQGLTASVSAAAADAAATAIATADAGGVHLHLSIGGTAETGVAPMLDAQVIDLPSSQQSPDVVEIVRALTLALEAQRAADRLDAKLPENVYAQRAIEAS